jgi:hypothetical protein
VIVLRPGGELDLEQVRPEPRRTAEEASLEAAERRQFVGSIKRIEETSRKTGRSMRQPAACAAQLGDR